MPKRRVGPRSAAQVAAQKKAAIASAAARKRTAAAKSRSASVVAKKAASVKLTKKHVSLGLRPEGKKARLGIGSGGKLPKPYSVSKSSNGEIEKRTKTPTGIKVTTHKPDGSIKRAAFQAVKHKKRSRR